MGFTKDRAWDNRVKKELRGFGRRVHPGGKTWTRRAQWLTNEHGDIKLKFIDGEAYREVLVPSTELAQTIWSRFKAGATIQDAISILGVEVPKSMHSRRADSL